MFYAKPFAPKTTRVWRRAESEKLPVDTLAIAIVRADVETCCAKNEEKGRTERRTRGRRRGGRGGRDGEKRGMQGESRAELAGRVDADRGSKGGGGGWTEERAKRTRQETARGRPGAAEDAGTGGREEVGGESGSASGEG